MEKNISKVKNSKWKIITKIKIDKSIHKNKNKNNIVKIIDKKIQKSFDKLKTKKIYCILISNPELMIKDKKVAKVIYGYIQDIKKKKYLEKFGYSIYNFNILTNLIKNFRPDLIQCPYNIFDRRLVEAGHLQKLKKEKILVHVRSIFLQGLLLMDILLPKKFMKWRKLFKNYHKWLQKNDIKALDACINFASKNRKIDKIIIGFNNINQLNEIINSKKFKMHYPKKLSSNAQNLINPTTW